MSSAHEHVEQVHTPPGAAHSHMEPENPLRVYTVVFIWLMVLLVLTVLADLLDVGALNILIALTIAIVKALLVLLYFMHVRYSGRLVLIFSGASFLWLGILLVLTFSDYTSRLWTPRRLSGLPVVPLFERSPVAPREAAPPPWLLKRGYVPAPEDGTSHGGDRREGQAQRSTTSAAPASSQPAPQTVMD